MADVTVTLHGNNISVDKPTVSASVSKGERVHWSCTGEFQIVFKPGSDWPNPQTRQQNGTWIAESGPFNKPNTTLFYGVTATGFNSLDPQIDVQP